MLNSYTILRYIMSLDGETSQFIKHACLHPTTYKDEVTSNIRGYRTETRPEPLAITTEKELLNRRYSTRNTTDDLPRTKYKLLKQWWTMDIYTKPPQTCQGEPRYPYHQR